MDITRTSMSVVVRVLFGHVFYCGAFAVVIFVMIFLASVAVVIVCGLVIYNLIGLIS